jgi:PAS domain S-box-containing protein
MRTMQIGSARSIRRHAGLAARLLPACSTLLAASAAALAAEREGVVVLLEEEVWTIVLLAVGVAALVVFAGMAAWILTLRREIAVRRRIERELRTSEERFRVVFEQAAVGISLRPAAARSSPFLRVNQKLCDILGYTREELQQLPVTALSPEDDQETANEYNRRVLSGELSSYSREKRYLRKDGQIIWTNVALSGVRDVDGRPSHLITVVQDITEQKRAEEALRMRQAKIESIFRGAPVGIGEVVGRVLTVANDRLCRMLGYAPEELIGQNSRLVYLSHDEWARVGRETFEQARDRGIGTAETRWRRKDGRVIDVMVSVTAIVPGNPGAGVTVTALDITGRKRAEQELARHRGHLEDLVRERTAELEAANRELQAFSYTVSHDLRGPLRAIIGFSSMLKKKSAEGEDRDLLERIERNAQRLGHMVDDLLDFSRLGRGEVSVQRFDPNPVVAEVIESTRASYPRATVTAAPLPAMTGDRGLLRQVFENLIGNALKFSAKAEKPAVEVGAKSMNGETVFFVRDNGAGFDMQHSDELFTVFKRLHPGEFEGSGVGLATVQRIVARHGGRVWAESAPQAGATFYFTLRA